MAIIVKCIHYIIYVYIIIYRGHVTLTLAREASADVGEEGVARYRFHDNGRDVEQNAIAPYVLRFPWEQP